MLICAHLNNRAGSTWLHGTSHRVESLMIAEDSYAMFT